MTVGLWRSAPMGRWDLIVERKAQLVSGGAAVGLLAWPSLSCQGREGHAVLVEEMWPEAAP